MVSMKERRFSILARLRFQLLLIDKKLQEVQPILNQAGHLVETWTGSVYQKEYLRVYFLVLQVSGGSGRFWDGGC